jgi:hypothetical protein
MFKTQSPRDTQPLFRRPANNHLSDLFKVARVASFGRAVFVLHSMFLSEIYTLAEVTYALALSGFSDTHTP